MLGELVEDEQGRLEVREISSSTMTSFLDICDGSTANNAQVVMAAAEVETVGYHFLLNIGRGSEWSPEEFDQVKLHKAVN